MIVLNDHYNPYTVEQPAPAYNILSDTKMVQYDSEIIQISSVDNESMMNNKRQASSNEWKTARTYANVIGRSFENIVQYNDHDDQSYSSWFRLLVVVFLSSSITRVRM
jgi:hypothetical protein